MHQTTGMKTKIFQNCFRQSKLQDATYDGASSPFLCASISEEILKAVKELDYDRYKYVVSVLIVEKANQAMIVSKHIICYIFEN